MKHLTTIKEGGYFKTYKEGVCFVFEQIGSFFVSRNAEVSFQLEDSNISDVVLKGYLNGTILTAQLTFTNHFVLHGGLFELEGKTIGLIGDSGLGKSTILQGLQLHYGASIFSDDLIAFKKHGNIYALHSLGFDGLRLWEESINAFNLNSKDFEKVHPNHSKLKVPIQQEAFTKKHLDALIVLNYGPEFKLDRLSKVEAFKHLLGHIKSKDYLPSDLEATHFTFTTALANLTPVYVLQRPKGFDRLPETLKLIIRGSF